MPLNNFLAQAIGLFMLVVGFATLAKRRTTLSIMREVAQGHAVAFFAGALALLFGLLLALRPTLWRGLLPAVVSATGWLLVAEGLCYFFLPPAALDRLVRWFEDRRRYYFFAALYIFLGLTLASLGFSG